MIGCPTNSTLFTESRKGRSLIIFSFGRSRLATVLRMRPSASGLSSAHSLSRVRIASESYSVSGCIGGGGGGSGADIVNVVAVDDEEEEDEDEDEDDDDDAAEEGALPSPLAPSDAAAAADGCSGRGGG